MASFISLPPLNFIVNYYNSPLAYVFACLPPLQHYYTHLYSPIIPPPGVALCQPHAWIYPREHSGGSLTTNLTAATGNHCLSFWAPHLLFGKHYSFPFPVHAAALLGDHSDTERASRASTVYTPNWRPHFLSLSRNKLSQSKENLPKWLPSLPYNGIYGDICLSVLLQINWPPF